MKYLFHLLLFLPLLAAAQSGDMRVYTVAGSWPITTPLGDGGPATNATLSSSEGLWMDGNCNLYFTDAGGVRIRKVNAGTGMISTVAGTGTRGFSGDGGPATNAKIIPYGLYVTVNGDILIADAGNNRIRMVKATTGIITTIVGGGNSLGDGFPATDAKLTDPANVYQDNLGNIYVGERSRIRKVDARTGIITTLAGTDLFGFSGDGGPATNAQVFAPTGMLMDASGNLIFADRGNSRIRKIYSNTNIIATIAGTTDGFSGDGDLAVNAQFSGPLTFALDKYSNLIIGDNQNNLIRKVDAVTGIVTSIAGVGSSRVGSEAEGEPATATQIHPEFIYLDLMGNLYFSNYGLKIRKITNLHSGLSVSGSRCAPNNVDNVEQYKFNINLFPNPVLEGKLNITLPDKFKGNLLILDNLGRMVLTQSIGKIYNSIDVSAFKSGFYIVNILDDKNISIFKSNFFKI